jgi:hypothetical protein
MSGVLSALQAQSAAIASLVEELRAGREQSSAPVVEEIKKTPDKAPAKKGHWYY